MFQCYAESDLSDYGWTLAIEISRSVFVHQSPQKDSVVCVVLQPAKGWSVLVTSTYPDWLDEVNTAPCLHTNTDIWATISMKTQVWLLSLSSPSCICWSGGWCLCMNKDLRRECLDVTAAFKIKNWRLESTQYEKQMLNKQNRQIKFKVSYSVS